MTSLPTLPDTEAIAGVTSVSAKRIGLISDNHSAQEDGSDLPEEALAALNDVDLIIHLGHLGVPDTLARGVLDRLEALAPVLAIRDYSMGSDRQLHITPAEGDRVTGLTRIVEAGGVRIGAVHNLTNSPGRPINTPPGGLPELADVPLAETLTEKFGQPVDIVAFAGSHRATAINSGGIFFVNPGSPTYPKGPGQNLLGTVGILEITEKAAAFDTISLPSKP
jgi:putative phosphoesterase